MNTMCRSYRRPRRGVTAVLAMLYMTLFTALALGFYASVTTAVQVSRNEQKTARALAASESGMNFIKYSLANLGVPPNTDPSVLFQTVYTNLAAQMTLYNGMMVIPGNPPTTWAGAKIWKDTANTMIMIPGDPTGKAAIATDGNASFRVVIYSANNQQLRVKVYGNYANVAAARATQLQYAIAENASMIFNYGVASKSAINLSGSVVVQGATAAMGSILSATTSTTTPLTMSGGASISGDASFVLSNPMLSLSTNSTIAGYGPTSPGITAHIHNNVGNVPFPLIDTAAFMPYVPAKTDLLNPQNVTAKNPSGTYFKNIRIKAGTNPSFQANTTIEGIVVVESPNQVKFTGQVNLTGVIVSETNPQLDPNNASFDLSQNTISFGGGINYKPIGELPTDNPTDFPAAERALTGTMLLTPGFAATFGGNFGSINGSILASQLTFSGGAAGTIIGSMVNLRDSATSIGGNNTITIQSAGTANYPAGVLFGSHYVPLPYTYTELAQ